jgi:LysR family transcriptional regulator, low CO2-responsive transcriptional regulator
MLDLHKLTIFRRVATFGSFSRAAQELALTQSAVSQHIQDLERMLGVTLFQRMARGALPTEAGIKLRDHTDALFQLVARIEYDLTDIRDTAQRQLNITATPGVAAYLLPAWIAGFQKVYPNIRCSVRSDESAAAISDLERKRSDVAVIEAGSGLAHEFRHCESRLIQSTSMYLVFSPDSGLFGAHGDLFGSDVTLQLIGLQNGTEMRARCDSLLSAAGIAFTVNAELDTIEALKCMLGTSPFGAVIPDYASQRERDSGTLLGLPLPETAERTVQLVRRTDSAPPPTARAFFDFVSDSAAPNPS